jgi:hypothetical protein
LTTVVVPIATRQLLGLNLKFCLSGNNMQQNINNTMLKMARSIRTSFYLKQHGIIQEGDYKKQIYVSLKNWLPPPAPLEIEEKMTTFEKLLKRKQEHPSTKNKKNKLTNLSPIQHKALTQLKQNKSIIIKPTDKNLGPTILDTKTYIKQILQEHLLTTSYTQLTKETAKNNIENLKLLRQHQNV